MNTLNSQNEMNNMEKKIYSHPTIVETRLDCEINLVLMSTPTEGTCFDEATQSYYTCLINPTKFLK
jgi:hypothetical protein